MSCFTIDSLPPLSQTIKQHKLLANKGLGQCFLHDFNLITKILSFAGDLQNQHVIEIGPGPGGLTRALLKAGAYVTAIEYDKRCLPILKEIETAYAGRLFVHWQDALKINYNIENLASAAPFYQEIKSQKAKIIANLPYNIGTQLLIKWLSLRDWPPFYDKMLLMFQKEVADRIVAQENDEAYGRLSILCNWRAKTKIVMKLPPSAFHPAPKIWSAIIELIPHQNPIACDIEALELITKSSFIKRRKMLRQSLKGLIQTQDFETLGIDPTRRPETLSIKEFTLLANRIKAS